MMEFGPRPAFNSAMSTAVAGDDANPEWEYAPLQIPAEINRPTAAAQLALHAEFGGWELARVLRYTDGTRRVVLRRLLRPANALPLPGLTG
jgi:hypothetical protein